MKRQTRLLFMAAPLAASTILFACSDDVSATRFEDAADGAADSGASLPDSARPDETDADAGIVDARAPFDASDEPVTCTTKPCATQLVVATNSYCALMDDKTVRCWGSTYNAFGVIDGGNTSDSFQGIPLDMGLSDVEQLSSANGTTCARHTDRTVTCWGANMGGELGLEPPSNDYVAHSAAKVTVDGGAVGDIARIDVGAMGVVFATKTSGEVWSWGRNWGDALGRDDDSVLLGPGRASALTGLKAVRASGFAGEGYGGFGYVVTDDRKLHVWGNSPWLVTYPGTAPVTVAGLENVTSVAESTARTCVVADGRLYCWGENGLLSCTGTKDGASSPVEIRTRGKAPAREVSLSYSATCVRLTDGTVECCGQDSFGTLASGDADAGAFGDMGESVRLLTEAKALTAHAVGIRVGLNSACALVKDGSVQCWGSNQSGELGQGVRDDDRHATPVTVKWAL